MQKGYQEKQNEPIRVRVRDFFYHLIVFIFVLALLYLVSGVSGAFVWLLVLWGVGVALHGVYAIFGP